MESSLEFSQGTLLLRGRSRASIIDVFGDDVWRWDARVEAWRCEASKYASIVDRLQRIGEVSNHRRTCENRAEAWMKVAWPKVDLPELRQEQLDAVQAWLVSKSGVVVMPTGTGKTEVALRIMHETRCSTLIVSPVRDLMYQWHRRILRGLGYDAGVIGDNTFNLRPVSVTTYDSASIHMPTFGNRFELLIFDECHHLPGRIRSDAARMSMATMRLGLTATPERSDGRQVDIETLIGSTVYNLSIADVRGRSLAEYDIVRIPVHLNDREQVLYDRLSSEISQYVYTRRQDDPAFAWKDVCAEATTEPESRRTLDAFRRKQSIENRAAEKLRVLEDLFRLHQGSPMIIFVGSNAMARDVSNRFLIPCLLSHCGKKERLDYLEGLKNHIYPAIVANQVLDEGVDLPIVKVAVVIGGMASKKQAKQRLGRILRRQNNQRAILYEVVCQDTTESQRSRQRRDNDAYTGTRHRRI
ncbi:MAG: DEAD/DEAH box helicase family protein [Pirellulaceae bacterium]|nr:DEAD/DEAH box helicase family protein [Pirellulaceae bacterium]